MEDEGRLTMSVEKVRSIPALRGQASRSGDFIAISVADTGFGIAVEHLGAIFEPFFTTKEVGKGTGLGLSQAFGFAKQSEGDIDVKSALGQGATFTIYLPQAAAPAGEAEMAAIGGEASTTGRGYRVLVVEDNDDVGQFSTELLEDLGYVVRRVANANAALRFSFARRVCRRPGVFRRHHARHERRRARRRHSPALSRPAGGADQRLQRCAGGKRRPRFRTDPEALLGGGLVANPQEGDVGKNIGPLTGTIDAPPRFLRGKDAPPSNRAAMPEKASGNIGRANHALDSTNFFLADVRDGLGPYLAIYLLTEQHWDEARIGVIMSIAAPAGIVAQTPAGALVDTTRAKRLVMVGATLCIMMACLLLPVFPSFWPVAVSQGLSHAAGAVLPPAIAAVSLGVVGHRAFTARIGRNEAFNHAGNAVAAAIAGGAAYLFGPSVVFYLLAAMSIASVVSILAIPENAIDHDLARGLHEGADTKRQQEAPSGLSILLTCRPLLIFSVCVTLFHLSNAAMLPLVGQKLALQDRNLGTSLMSACITAAQIVMVPMAMLVGAKADCWGHKRFFFAALLILPIRGALYTLSDNKAWLVGVQLLDGIGAGIFGASFPVIVADLMRNTGRFNVAQGAIITAQSIGAALSMTVAGLIVVKLGYSAAFLSLGAIAGIGAIVCRFALPETRKASGQSNTKPGQTVLTTSGIAAG